MIYNTDSHISTSHILLTPSEVDVFNRLMNECFDICEKQQAGIYETTFSPWC